VETDGGTVYRESERLKAAIEVLDDFQYKMKDTLSKANELLASKRKADCIVTWRIIDVLRDTIKEIETSLGRVKDIRGDIIFTDILLDGIINIKDITESLVEAQAIAQRPRNDDGRRKSQATRKAEIRQLKRCVNRLKQSLSDLQNLQNKTLVTALLKDPLMKINNIEERLLQDSWIGTEAQKKEMKETVMEIGSSIDLLLLASLGKAILEDLPVENEFGEPEEPVSPRVICKSLLSTIDYAKRELEIILQRSDVRIRPLLLPNGSRRLQVGPGGFGLEKAKGWKGWMVKNVSDGKKLIYKDLVVEEIPRILSGLAQDLRTANEIIKQTDITIEEAIEYARKAKAATIERGVNLYEGWDPEERAYRSLRSRYASPSIMALLISLTALICLGFLFGHPILFPLQVVDTAISWLLVSLLIYITYLALYGFFSKSGRFMICRDDLSESVPRDKLLPILSEETKQRLDIVGDRISMSAKDIIYGLTKEEFNELISKTVISTCLFINNLPRRNLLDIFSKLGIGKSNLSKKEMSSKILELALPLVEKSNEFDEKEQQKLKDIFPLHCIIIPAVNDPNLIEQVSRKVTSVDYPNIIFFLALEEKDKESITIVRRAQVEGKLPGNVIPYFGPIRGPNKPGKPYKPQSKPKIVNLTIAHIQAIVEGLIGYTEIQLRRLPDFLMIWDLEDDPAKQQIWSMLTADAMIKSTLEDLVERMKSGNSLDVDKLGIMFLKRENPDLYNRALRWGIDPNLPKKLKGKYGLALRELQNQNFATEQARLQELIRRIGIESDLNLLMHIMRGYREVSNLENMRHKYDPDPQRLKDNYDRLLEGIYEKYSSEERFILSEFQRRSIPANYEGILIAKMFGENPLSHLEWLLWFNLILPGLAAYRYDKTIIPAGIAGAIVGAVFGGIFGALIGLSLGSIFGYFTGRLTLSLGADFRNTIPFNFSAGTSQNFSFNTLVYQLSAYPEYNVAEDWALALRMAKMGFRTLLIDSYETPTYEESLPPLGIRLRSCIRWWIQHSRWIGGHFQSIPQILNKPLKKIREFGLANFFHATMCVVFLSIGSLLAIWIILRTLFWIIILGMTQVTPLSTLTSGLLSYFPSLLWWLPNDFMTSIAFFILGPIVIVALGILAILKERPDEEELVNKSIDDLRETVEELRNQNNKDVKVLLKEIDRLREIADELEVERDKEKLLEKAERLKQKRGGIRKIEIEKRWSLWEESEMIFTLEKVFLSLAEAEKPWEELRRIADEIEKKLDAVIDREVVKQMQRVKRREKGELSIAFITVRIGKMRYARLQKFVMNFFMPYYYLHATPASILYFRQIVKEMDSQWRQTAHRVYGEKFEKIVVNVLKDYYNNQNKKGDGGRSTRGEISKLIKL
jgi:hypothetical protein